MWRAGVKRAPPNAPKMGQMECLPPHTHSRSSGLDAFCSQPAHGVVRPDPSANCWTRPHANLCNSIAPRLVRSNRSILSDDHPSWGRFQSLAGRARLLCLGESRLPPTNPYSRARSAPRAGYWADGKSPTPSALARQPHASVFSTRAAAACVARACQTSGRPQAELIVLYRPRRSPAPVCIYAHA